MIIFFFRETAIFIHIIGTYAYTMYIDARDAFESNGVVIRIEYEIINRYTAYVMDGKLI